MIQLITGILMLFIALGPADIKKFFQPVLERALTIFNAYKSADEKKSSKTKMPFVTVSWTFI